MGSKRFFGRKPKAGEAEMTPNETPQVSTDAIEQIVKEAVESGTKKALKQSHEAIQEVIKEVVDETRKSVQAVAKESKKAGERAQAIKEMIGEEGETQKLRPEMRPHAFVVMPFGRKKGGDGSLYDFNVIYQTLIKPALEAAGFEPFRADEATTSGDILTDMFQELLLADLVIADLSIDNANAFYELGIRHAFRKRGVVHIQAGRAYMPFDIFNVRTLPYHINDEGVPDPEFLEKDIQAIARMTRDTWASDRDAIHSPIFNLLPGLDEPDDSSLRTPLATGFWREYNEWRERVTIAQRQKRIGDIMLLTEEISHPLIKEEAIGQAGRALANMDRNELALAQYRKGLEINPRNLTFRREEAFHLNRIGKVDEAIVRIENILEDFPGDSDSIAYLGRIYKEMWTDSWKWVADPEKRLRMAFESYHWLIKSYQIYVRGFRSDLNECYPGGNALTLATILIHLADRFDDPNDPDPEISMIRDELPELRGTLEFALEIKAASENADYWTLVSLADLRVLTADSVSRVVRAYRKAMTASRRNEFFLQSSIQQLEILQSLEIRSGYVEAGIKVLREEMARIHKEEYVEKGEDNEALDSHDHEKGRVFLFAGYMLDNPGGKSFLRDLESEIKSAIQEALENYNVGPKDLAILAGMAAGSDLLFIEACVERNVPVSTHMPVPETLYVRDFVSPAGDDWVDRFYKMRNHPLVDEYYQFDLVGKPKDEDDIFERNNRWAVYSAMARGVDNVKLIALFDDKSSVHKSRDARLVKHIVELMRDTGGQVEFINPTKLPGIMERKEKRQSKERAPKS